MVNRDYRDLLASFTAADVRYMVVGAYAVTFAKADAIVNKRATARPQDLEDVKALEGD